MRRTLIPVLLALLAVRTGAQEPPAPEKAPDYRRETLVRIFANNEERPRPEPRVKFGLGGIEFKALGTRWRIGFLPFLAPFPGSYPTTNPTFPDPFALTGTEYAYTPRTWRERRARNAEMRRIERTERERAKIRVK